MSLIEVKVPDIGDFSDVPVIDLFVKVGDPIKVDDAIATLESDKATMDVPSTVEGTVKEVLIQLGSRVSEGAVLIKVEAGAAAGAAPVAAPESASIPASTADSRHRRTPSFSNSVSPDRAGVAPASPSTRSGKSWRWYTGRVERAV